MILQRLDDVAGRMLAPLQPPWLLGRTAALAQQHFWEVMLLTLVVFGPGKLSLDGLVAARARPGGRG
jgi:uncharacterized membrane protein YphA (DoxX/SURF4 family)